MGDQTRPSAPIFKHRTPDKKNMKQFKLPVANKQPSEIEAMCFRILNLSKPHKRPCFLLPLLPRLLGPPLLSLLLPSLVSDLIIYSYLFSWVDSFGADIPGSVVLRRKPKGGLIIKTQHTWLCVLSWGFVIVTSFAHCIFELCFECQLSVSLISGFLLSLTTYMCPLFEEACWVFFFVCDFWNT